MSTAVIEMRNRHEMGNRREIRAVRPTTSLRLTRRGRLVVRTIVLPTLVAAAFTGMTMLGSPAESTSQQRHVVAETVVVGPGETLWTIAATVAPEQDRREVIAEIVRLNALPDAGAITAGQELFVPSQ